MKTIEDVKTMKNFLATEEVDYLFREASLLPAGSSVLNIGTYYGASAAALACGMKAGKLTIVDVFMYHNAGPPEVIPFRERTDVKWTGLPKDKIIRDIEDYLGNTSLTITQAYSDDVVLEELKNQDLIFIDGDHTTHACLLDALKFSQILVSKGKLLFHDYTNFKQVRDAVSMFMTVRPDFTFEKQVGSIHTLRKE